MNPLDYTLEEWIDEWMKAHADDELTFSEYLKQSAAQDSEPPALSDTDEGQKTVTEIKKPKT